MYNHGSVSVSLPMEIGKRIHLLMVIVEVIYTKRRQSLILIIAMWLLTIWCAFSMLFLKLWKSKVHMGGGVEHVLAGTRNQVISLHGLNSVLTCSFWLTWWETCDLLLDPARDSNTLGMLRAREEKEWGKLEMLEEGKIRVWEEEGRDKSAVWEEEGLEKSADRAWEDALGRSEDKPSPATLWSRNKKETLEILIFYYSNCNSNLVILLLNIHCSSSVYDLSTWFLVAVTSCPPATSKYSHKLTYGAWKRCECSILLEMVTCCISIWLFQYAFLHTTSSSPFGSTREELAGTRITLTFVGFILLAFFWADDGTQSSSGSKTLNCFLSNSGHILLSLFMLAYYYL